MWNLGEGTDEASPPGHLWTCVKLESPESPEAACTGRSSPVLQGGRLLGVGGCPSKHRGAHVHLLESSQVCNDRNSPSVQTHLTEGGVKGAIGEGFK